MALINCPVCGKQVSDRAKICIGCGSALDIGYITCEKCGKAVAEGTKCCVFCGALVGITFIDCPECGAQMPEDTQACTNCGCPLNIEFITCPECGAQMPVDTVICDNCGFPLDEEAPVDTVSTESDEYTEDIEEEPTEPDCIPEEVKINDSVLKADAIKQKRVFSFCSIVALILSELALFAAIFVPMIFIADAFDGMPSIVRVLFYNDFIDYSQVVANISDIDNYLYEFAKTIRNWANPYGLLLSVCISMACRYVFVFLHKFFDKKVREIKEEIKMYTNAE